MPKQSLVLNGFVGGINKDADAADLRSQGSPMDKSGNTIGDEVVTSNQLFLDRRGKVVGEYPQIVSQSGVATCDSLTISASWENTTTSIPFTQKADQSGGAQVPTGTGIKVTCTVSSGNPTFVIVEGGTGYKVDDTIIFVDPGSTTNEATLVVASLNADKVSADSNNTATAEKVLVYNDTLYQNQGVYKIGEAVNYSGNENYVINPPQQGSLNPDSASAIVDGVDAAALSERSDDVLVFLGKTAAQNNLSGGRIMDATALGDGSTTGNTGPADVIRYTLDAENPGNGKAGESWAFWTETNQNEDGYVINTANNTGGHVTGAIEANVTITDSSGDAIDFSSTSSAVSTITADRLNFWKTADDGRSAFIYFRGGNSDYSGGATQNGHYGTTFPNLAGKDLAVELYVRSTTNLDGFFIFASTRSSNEEYLCKYDHADGDADAKVWKISAELIDEKSADNGFVRIILPADGYSQIGGNYSDTGVKFIGVGPQYTGDSGTNATNAFIEVKEISFIESGTFGWNANSYTIYQTTLKNELESLASAYTTTYTGTQAAAAFTIYKPSASRAGKIYYQNLDDAGAKSGDLFLLAEYDYTKGVKTITSDTFEDWVTGTPDYFTFSYDSPPIRSTFTFETGYPDDAEFINSLWKSSTTVGRQAYIGNCAKEKKYELIDTSTNALIFGDGNTTLVRGTGTWENAGFTASTGFILISGSSSNDGLYTVGAFSGTTLNISGANFTSETKITGNISITQFEAYDGSLILKSTIGKEATFPDTQYIDLEFGGEVINVLESSGDRLLVFSDNKLSIINVAQDIEFIEATFDYYGVSKHRQVCKVGEGVAFVNSTGVYFFNGQQIESLSDSMLKTETFDGSNCAVGFDSKRNILYVWQSATAIYFFSFITGSWVGHITTSANSIPDTNVIAGKDQFSFFELNGNIEYIGTQRSSSVTDRCMLLQTGKIHCGNIAQRKKFYKLYITATNGSNMVVQIRTDDSHTSFTNVFSGNLSDGINEISLTSSGLLSSSSKGKYIEILIKDGSDNGKSNLEIGDISLIYREKSIK